MKEEISFPKRIKFFINFKCNFNCSYCYLPESFFKRKEKNIERVCEKLSEYKVREIEILGGEPFLNKERIKYFLNFCISSKIYLRSISTNGQFIKKEILELLKKFENLTIQVSLDAATLKTYKIVRRSSSFARVINNIRILKENKIRTVLSFVANEKNWKELKNFITLAKKLKVDGISLGGFIPIGRGRKIKSWQLDMKEIIQIYYLVKKQKNINIFGVEEKGCPAGKEEVALLPNGDIFPCGLFIAFPETKLENIFQKEWISNREFYFKLINFKIPSKCFKYPLPSLCPGGCKAFIYSMKKESSPLNGELLV